MAKRDGSGDGGDIGDWRARSILFIATACSSHYSGLRQDWLFKFHFVNVIRFKLRSRLAIFAACLSDSNEFFIVSAWLLSPLLDCISIEWANKKSCKIKREQHGKFNSEKAGENKRKCMFCILL